MFRTWVMIVNPRKYVQNFATKLKSIQTSKLEMAILVFAQNKLKFQTWSCLKKLRNFFYKICAQTQENKDKVTIEAPTQGFLLRHRCTTIAIRITNAEYNIVTALQHLQPINSICKVRFSLCFKIVRTLRPKELQLVTFIFLDLLYVII